MSNYKVTIGIECHVQLKTRTKLFAPVGNDAREAPANTLISHICLGMPGALPVLNKAAVDLAIKAAHALNTNAERFSAFDRKHYFYPDLPKGYQISQLHYPIIASGSVVINVNGGSKTIGITRAHLEEDAGKSTHPQGKDYSLVDLNRAGTPLLEIVSEPEITSAAEAKAYVRELYLLMKYADVSEADLYYGNMRFDVNLSLSNTDVLGNRTETKNLNSFRAVEKAVEYEIKRQTEILDQGGTVLQETRGWDDAKQRTFSQRSKEDAHDYRYFPDPDIPPIILEPDYIRTITDNMPESVDQIRTLIKNAGASESLTEAILDNRPLAMIILELISSKPDKKMLAIAVQWLGQLVPKLADDNNLKIEAMKINLQHILKLAEMVGGGALSSSQGKIVFEKVCLEEVDPERYAQEHDLLQMSDSGELIAIVKQVLADNSKAAEDVSSGEMKAIGFLVGQVMKASRGKANPELAQSLIRRELGLK